MIPAWVAYLIGVAMGALFAVWAMARSSARRERMVDVERELRRDLEQATERARFMRMVNGDDA